MCIRAGRMPLKAATTRVLSTRSWTCCMPIRLTARETVSTLPGKPYSTLLTTRSTRAVMAVSLETASASSNMELSGSSSRSRMR